MRGGRDTNAVQPRASRMSKQVMQAFQANKFQNIRKANEGKREFYQEAARKSRMAARREDDESANIEVHLLQRKFEQEIGKRVDVGGRQESKRMNNLRETFLMNIQSKRFG